MSLRLVTAVSVAALISACSSQPGPSSLSPLQQGETALRAGNFAVAEQAFTSALSANPNDPSAMLGLAQVYDASNRSAEAVELYQKVAAARSGAIRVWNDGGVRQEGVTEIASRRLGALGHGMDQRAAAPAPAPVVAPPAPVVALPAPIAVPEPAPVIQTEVWPQDPVYALDPNGMVFYADPEATQPITTPVFMSREAAEITAPVVSHDTLPTFEPIAPIAPVIQETYAAPAPIITAPIPVAPAPVVQTTTQPQEPTYALGADGTIYYADPDGTQPISERVFETREAAEQGLPAAAHRTISSFAPTALAPIEAAPVTFTPAPAIQPIAPAPIVNPTPTIAAPAPISVPVPSISTATPAPAGPLPRTQPGYAVVNGDFVYISAEDIARAAGTQSATQSTVIPAPAPQSFNVPTSIDAPALPPLIELNGIPNLNLN